jgi:PAS domain S-box-containing protein
MAEQPKALNPSGADPFRTLFEHVPDAIFLLDPHDSSGAWPIVDCNEAAARMHGYARAEIVGQSIDMFNARPGTSALEPSSLERQRQAGTIHGEDVHRRKDGALLFIAYSTTLITLDGRELVLGIERDVTAQRRAATLFFQTLTKADQANRAKIEFLARVSHELRTPLTVMLGYAHLLEVKLVEPGLQEFAAHISTAGELLLRHITDLLDTAGAAGQPDITLHRVDLHQSLHAAFGRLRALAGSQQVHVDLRQTEQGPRWVLADRERLTEVLMRLLDNAIKFNRRGGTVTVTSAAATDRVRVNIHDTGDGIPDNEFAKLFVPFERLHAEQAGIGGVGVGLALAKYWIERMGGSIGVESRLGEGSTFWIELGRA